MRTLAKTSPSTATACFELSNDTSATHLPKSRGCLCGKRRRESVTKGAPGRELDPFSAFCRQPPNVRTAMRA